MGIVSRSPSFLLDKSMCYAKRGIEDFPHVKSGEVLDHQWIHEHYGHGSQSSVPLQMSSINHSPELHLPDLLPLQDNSAIYTNAAASSPCFLTRSSWSKEASDCWQEEHKSSFLYEHSLLSPAFESLISSCLLEPQFDLSLSQLSETNFSGSQDEDSFMRLKLWQEAKSPGEFLGEMEFFEYNANSGDSVTSSKISKEPYYIQVPNIMSPGSSTYTIDLLKLQQRLEEERAANLDTFICDITRKLQSGLDERTKQSFSAISTAMTDSNAAGSHGHNLQYMNDISTSPYLQHFMPLFGSLQRHPSPYLTSHYSDSHREECSLIKSDQTHECNNAFVTSTIFSDASKNSLDILASENSMKYLGNPSSLAQKTDVVSDQQIQWGYGANNTRSFAEKESSGLEHGDFGGINRKEERRLGLDHPESSSNKRIHLDSQVSQKNLTSWTPLRSCPSTKQESSHNTGTKSFISKNASGPALNTNHKPRARQGSANDPQSIAARHRRERISERLKTLQELVPNGTKVDLVTMLEKAMNYVKFLQLQVKVLASDEYWPHQDTMKAHLAAQDTSKNNSNHSADLEAHEISEKISEATNIC